MHISVSVLISGLVQAICTCYYNYAVMKYLHELLKNEFEDRIVSVKTKLIDIIWLISQENHY